MKTTMFVMMVGVGLCSCATNSGVIPMGKDLFMVSRSDNSPLASLSGIKAAALKDVGDYCGRAGNAYVVVGGYDVPRALGQFPQTEVQFRCVPK